MEIFVTALTIFMLAVFVGFEIITKIPPTLLETPWILHHFLQNESSQPWIQIEPQTDMQLP